MNIQTPIDLRSSLFYLGRYMKPMDHVCRFCDILFSLQAFPFPASALAFESEREIQKKNYYERKVLSCITWARKTRAYRGLSHMRTWPSKEQISVSLVYSRSTIGLVSQIESGHNRLTQVGPGDGDWQTSWLGESVMHKRIHRTEKRLKSPGVEHRHCFIGINTTATTAIAAVIVTTWRKKTSSPSNASTISVRVLAIAFTL